MSNKELCLQTSSPFSAAFHQIHADNNKRVRQRRCHMTSRSSTDVGCLLLRLLKSSTFHLRAPRQTSPASQFSIQTQSMTLKASHAWTDLYTRWTFDSVVQRLCITYNCVILSFVLCLIGSFALSQHRLSRPKCRPFPRWYLQVYEWCTSFINDEELERRQRLSSLCVL